MGSDASALDPSTAAAQVPPVGGHARPAKPATGVAAHIDRYLAPLLITLILLLAQLMYGVLESYWKTLLAIVTSMAVEMVLGRLVTKKWPHLASAYITGISVGILIRSTTFWPYALCAAISIVSKYAIRVNGRHLWNPSNLGVSSMLYLAPWAVAPLMVQFGNNRAAMYVIWTLGCLIIGRLRRFHICLTYVLAFLAFTVVRCHFTGQGYWTEVAPITGPPYQLFIFFMITDPKTTVRSRLGQCLTAVAIAAAETLFRLGQSVHAPYYALFCVGPAANLIEIIYQSRIKRAAAAPPAGSR